MGGWPTLKSWLTFNSKRFSAGRTESLGSQLIQSGIARQLPQNEGIVWEKQRVCTQLTAKWKITSVDHFLYVFALSFVHRLTSSSLTGERGGNVSECSQVQFKYGRKVLTQMTQLPDLSHCIRKRKENRNQSQKTTYNGWESFRMQGYHHCYVCYDAMILYLVNVRCSVKS